MNRTEMIGSAYGMAKERYAAIGIDTDKAIAILEETPISLHCWQTDDVMGFESQSGLSGAPRRSQPSRSNAHSCMSFDIFLIDCTVIKALSFFELKILLDAPPSPESVHTTNLE